MEYKNFKFIHISDLYIGREIKKKYSFLDPNQEIRVRHSPIKVLKDLAKKTQIVVLIHDEVFAKALSKSSIEVKLIDLNAS